VAGVATAACYGVLLQQPHRKVFLQNHGKLQNTESRKGAVVGSQVGGLSIEHDEIGLSSGEQSLLFTSGSGKVPEVGVLNLEEIGAYNWNLVSAGWRGHYACRRGAELCPAGPPRDTTLGRHSLDGDEAGDPRRGR
jgi:hypothetical protein